MKNKIKYQKDLHVYNEVLHTYKDNRVKLFTTIMTNFCSKTMKNQIEEISDYKSQIRDDPIELLAEIKKMTYVLTWSKYVYEVLIESLKQLLNTKQDEQENLIDYTKRFKQAQDMHTAVLGKGILNFYVKKTTKYQALSDDDEKKQMKQDEFQTFLTLIFMKNGDQQKYGELIKDLK